MRFERCLRGSVRKRKVEPSETIFQELVDAISIARKSFPSTLYPAGPQMLLIVSGAFFARSRISARQCAHHHRPLEARVLRLQPCPCPAADVARAERFERSSPVAFRSQKRKPGELERSPAFIIAFQLSSRRICGLSTSLP